MRRYSELFVTGTDTGIGKTLVTSALAFYFARRGERMSVMKPIETGLASEDPNHLPDFRLLQQSAKSPLPEEAICPVQYSQPLTPSIAAELSEQPFQLSTLDEAFEKVKQGAERTLVEGCGGLLAPLQPKFRVLDLIRRWSLPVLIVGRAGLGTINHTGMTIELCRHAGLEVLGVVLSQTSPEEDPSCKSNPEVIEREFDVTVFGTIPFIDLETPFERVEHLANHFSYGSVGARLLQTLG